MGVYTMLVMLVFVLLLYFAIVRPQRRRDDRFALMVASVRPGMKIYAGGGIYGEVTEVRRDSVVLVTAPARTVLEIDADRIEQVEGFDYKAERSRQKQLRSSRTMRGPK